MARRFTLVTKDFQDYATDLVGISKDTWIDEGNPADNYGASNCMICQRPSSGNEGKSVLEIKMPLEADVIGFGEIESVELLLWIRGIGGGVKTVAILELEDIWDEGTQGGGGCGPGLGAAGEASWDDAQPATPWRKGSGAVLSGWQNVDAGETILDSRNFSSTGVFATFDLTPALSLGDRKTFVLILLDSTLVAHEIRFKSKEDATPSQRPILRVIYRSYPPDGFVNEADKLRIIPNPDNPAQPKLTWGGVDTDDFLQYKLYRDTSPITAIDGFKSAITVVSMVSDYFEIDGDYRAAFPVGSTFKITGSSAGVHDGRWTVSAVSLVSGDTRIEVVEDVTSTSVSGYIHHGIWTSIDPASEEFIDTFAHVDNITYYYKLIAEDQDNHEDDALLSAPVNFTKPDVTAATITPATPNPVGTLHTITVTSPQNIKKLFVDWDDGSTSWYEFETVGTSKTATHTYTKDVGGGGFTAQVRVQDEKGFWSALQAANNVRVDDTLPTAKLVVNVHKALVGDEVTLNGSYSQPAASNMGIIRYRFKRDASDSWQDNGTDPIFTFDSGVYPNTVGIKTASLEVQSLSALINTDTATYELETATPTEITPGVTGGLSIDTKIHELPRTLGRMKDVAMPIGSAGVEHEADLGRKAERFVIHATSHFPSMEDDITIIRNAWLNNTFLRLKTFSEMETKDVQYDFKLDGDVTLGYRNDNMVNWSFPVRVITRTEIAKPKVKGDITAFADGGGGKVQATSNGHGLLVGQQILITGTINYDGTYTLTNVTTNTFKFVATWVSDDAMGLWRKVGVS